MKGLRLEILAFCFFALSIVPIYSEEPVKIKLPEPTTSGGMPLMDALKNRKSTRDFATNDIPVKLLSDLLWAGFGINRPETSHRTAPSAMNSQEIDIYVAKSDGVFIYDAKTHSLLKISDSDLRRQLSNQPFAKDAPLLLIFVADYSRAKANAQHRELYAYIDTGYISQNMYLFCASEGLGTVVHELDRNSVSKLLGLRPEQKPIIAQTVGYPKAK